MLIIKAVHILAVISWMAGLLYLPRLFVYHAGAIIGTEQGNTFIIMEQRLLKFIMFPAGFVTFLTGLILAYAFGTWGQLWFLIKFFSVLIMLSCHIGFIKIAEGFMLGEKPRSAKYYKIINEIPTLLMIIIVFMVILKPF
jgi:protoporphyrinogen IX oxidase